MMVMLGYVASSLVFRGCGVVAGSWGDFVIVSDYRMPYCIIHLLILVFRLPHVEVY